MRKIKNKKTDKLKKIKNLLGEFYSEITCPEEHIEEIEKLSKKELRKKAACLKTAVEITHAQLRVDEKYKFYINLYFIYEMLCIYFQKEKLFIDKRKVDPYDDESIEEKLGYETAFSKNVNKKVDDTLYWLSCSLNKLVVKYRVCIKNYNQVLKEIEREIDNSPRILKNGITGLEKEMDYINKILVRTSYARKNVGIIYSLEESWKEEDKKTRTMVKATLTRVEKILDILVKDIEEE